MNASLRAPEEHYRRIRRILLFILSLNWLVALAKITYGMLSRCESMTADGFHSLADGASNIIGLVGIHFSCQPKDSDHPYGHRKYETFFSLGIVVLLVLVAWNIAQEGFTHLFSPQSPRIDATSFFVMLVTMTINFWVMRYEKKKGEFLHSDILTSDAMHTKADLLTSCTVVIALVGIRLGYPIIDPLAALVISFFILRAAYSIVKRSSAVLCDAEAIMDHEKICNVVLGVKGALTCHKIRTRGRPDDIHIDLHVQVDGRMQMEDAHKISYAIEEAIKKEIPQITDVIVHLEPQEKR